MVRRANWFNLSSLIGYHLYLYKLCWRSKFKKIVPKPQYKEFAAKKKYISWYRGFGLLLSRHPLSRGTRCVTVVNAWWVPPTRYHRPCRNRWEEYKEIRKGLVHWRVCSVCWQEGTWLSIAFCQRYLSSSVHTDCPLYLRVFSIIRIGCVTSSLGFRNITNIKTKMSVELPNVIFVLGGPGAGKGTQCAKIVEVEKAMR